MLTDTSWLRLLFPRSRWSEEIAIICLMNKNTLFPSQSKDKSLTFLAFSVLVYRWVWQINTEVHGSAIIQNPTSSPPWWNDSSWERLTLLTYDNKKCIPLRSSETISHKAHTFTFSSILTSGPSFSLFRWVLSICSSFSRGPLVMIHNDICQSYDYWWLGFISILSSFPVWHYFPSLLWRLQYSNPALSCDNR